MTLSRLSFAALVVVVPYSFDSLPLAAGIWQSQITPTEELIAEKDPSCAAEDKEDVASLDGRKVAWRAPIGQKWSVVVNGARQGGTYDDVRALTFGPDGQRLAFAARQDKRWMLVFDGTESPATYDEIKDPVFNPQTGRPTYAAKRDKRWLIVEDGKEGSSTYADVGLPEYSDDGKHMLLPAKPAKKWALVVDGNPQPGEFDEIVVQRFSPGGRHVAYVGRRGNKFIAVVDGKEGKPFDIIGGLTFGQNGNRWGYAGVDVHRGFGKEKGVGHVVIDGVEGPEFEGNQIGSLLGNMARGSVPHLLLGYFEQLLSGPHGVTAPVFSPDGQRSAYAARQAKDAATVIHNEERSATVPAILAGPLFSPDGQHLAWVISDGGGVALVVDGTKVGAASADETDFVTGLFFAPDSRRVAYVGVNGGDWYERGFTRRARRRVYLDGVAGTEYDAMFLGRLQFTLDGNHLSYVVGRTSENSRNVSFVVIDRAEGKRYDDIFGWPRIGGDGRSISYIAQAGRKFYVVTQPLARETTE